MPEVIVIGTGGVGSAALLELARRGVDVLGLDRFPPGHDRGSSHGVSRIIRRSYFEHSDYVPLLNLAYELWDDLAEVQNASLLHRTGLLYFGAAEGVVIQGVLASAKQHNLGVDELSVIDAANRFPGFVAPANASVLFEKDAGYLLVEDCVTACIDEAKKLGAELRHGEEVLNWSADGRGVVVETNKGKYEADRLVITAGCWARSLLADLNVPLRVVRKHLHWYQTESRHLQQKNACPCFFYETMDGYFYGFPDVSGHGLKVAEHSGGTEITDPLADDRQDEPEDLDRIQTFLKTYLPRVSEVRARHDVCFYTMSPDEHFLIDRHPEHSRVTFAAGLSGHGFKFASALGRILAELTLDGHSQTNINFLNLRRTGLQ